MRFYLKTEKYYSANEIFNLELTLKLILALHTQKLITWPQLIIVKVHTRSRVFPGLIGIYKVV